MSSNDNTASKQEKTRIMMVDDHPLMREGMARFLNLQEDLDLCCDAGSVEEALVVVAECNPALAIIDISLAPSARGQGVGGAILQDVLDQARRTGKAVSIHVETNNPARRLYQRLGFEVAEDQGVYDLMRAVS